jgi:hypothetical protein
LQDITKIKILEQELMKTKGALEETVKERTKELQKALSVKSSFLANMSHGNYWELLYSTNQDRN